MENKTPNGLPLSQSPAARLVLGAVAGTVVSALLWPRQGPLSLLGGWAVLAFVFTGWTWSLLWCFSPHATKRHAGQEQLGHRPAIVMILVGALASLSGVWVLFTRGHDDGDYAPRLLAVGSVLLSWLTIHTLFALIYAKSFYADGHGSGIDFNRPHGNHEHPSYPDFFYVAFAIGVSFAISDTNLTSRRMRKIALGHSLLSFVFGAMIIASVVNLLSSH
ncbi:DUF1345 domain-containing protein [Mycobacterium sp. M26]|uniref:DUF1345 domain-containing protein n=1 Tax=Mycobacterium sp. M26 TaxID=1762962 RepID=UPI00073EA91D|nr:DUF1345 domain-containing protein [Mycobacterium sp. M26]